MLFFFNLAGAVYDPDVVGIELPSMDDARVESVRFAGEYIREHPTLVWAGEEVRVEVTDIKRLILFTVIVLGIDAPAALRPHQSATVAPPRLGHFIAGNRIAP